MAQGESVVPAPDAASGRCCGCGRSSRTDDSWNREALGIWDEIAKQFSPFNGVACGRTALTSDPQIDAKPDGLAVDMSHDRDHFDRRVLA